MLIKDFVYFFIKKRRKWELNPRHMDYDSIVLTTELFRHKTFIVHLSQTIEFYNYHYLKYHTYTKTNTFILLSIELKKGWNHCFCFLCISLLYFLGRTFFLYFLAKAVTKLGFAMSVKSLSSFHPCA